MPRIPPDVEDNDSYNINPIEVQTSPQINEDRLTEDFEASSTSSESNDGNINESDQELGLDLIDQDIEVSLEIDLFGIMDLTQDDQVNDLS